MNVLMNGETSFIRLGGIITVLNTPPLVLHLLKLCMEDLQILLSTSQDHQTSNPYSLTQQDQIIQVLRHTLSMVQAQMKFQADSMRTDVEIEEQDLIYVQLQPYRRRFVAKRSSKKRKRFYRPFPVKQNLIQRHLQCLWIPKYIQYSVYHF